MTKNPKKNVTDISVYPRGKKWAYLVTLEADLITGKRPRLYQGGFETYDEALAAAIKAKEEAESGRRVSPSRRTVKQFLDEWISANEESVKPTTTANYRDYTNGNVGPMIGDRKLQEITVPVLNALYKRLLNEGRRRADTNSAMYEYWRIRQEQRDGMGPPPNEIAKACGTSIYAARAAVLRYRRGRIPVAKSKGLAPKTVTNIHRMLHRAFKDAVAWQYIMFNPAEHAALPRIKRKDRKRREKPWTVTDLAAWLKLAMADRYAGMWVLAATTGMRRSELAGISRGSVRLWADCGDCDSTQMESLDHCEKCESESLMLGGTLVIDDTRVVVAGKAEDSDGKSDDSVREISLDAFTVVALRRHLDMLDEERQAFGQRPTEQDKLMVLENGKPLHPDTITRRFNRLVDRAKVRRIRLHDVRHTYSTVATDAGVDIKILSDRIGHADMTTTLRIYTHQSTGRDRKAAELVAALIEEALKAAS